MFNNGQLGTSLPFGSDIWDQPIHIYAKCMLMLILGNTWHTFEWVLQCSKCVTFVPTTSQYWYYYLGNLTTPFICMLNATWHLQYISMGFPVFPNGKVHTSRPRGVWTWKYIWVQALCAGFGSAFSPVFPLGPFINCFFPFVSHLDYQEPDIWENFCHMGLHLD